MKYFKVKKYLFPGILCRVNVNVLWIVCMFVGEGGWICTAEHVTCNEFVFECPPLFVWYHQRNAHNSATPFFLLFIV